MIYTVTLNPSLDYIVSMDQFEMNMTNRTTEEHMFPGGKGINVSIVLNNLGIESTALGFIAGFTGDKIKSDVDNLGLKEDFICVKKGFSRINVKLKDYDGTEINGMGPNIEECDIEMLYKKLDCLEKGDILILAGSIPKCLSGSMYHNIMRRLSKKEILFVVDATKNLLLNVLEFHPFLIKPNHHELGEMFDVKLLTKEEVVPYARRLQEMGARNVLVSMSGEGAVLVDETGEIYMLQAPKGNLVNAVGAGDSMVAGFLAGWMSKKDYEYAFRMGVAAGSASAFSENFASKEEIQVLYEQMLHDHV